MIDITEIIWKNSSFPLGKRFKGMRYMISMNKQLIKVALSVALFVAVILPASAQQHQHTKIGVVNVQVIFERSPQTKAVMDALSEEFAPLERDLLAKQKEITDLREKLQKDLAVMGETERRNADKEQRDLVRDYERLQTEFQEDANLRQNEEFAELQHSLVKEIQDYSESQGFDLVLGEGTLYVSAAVNITEDVLNAIIAKYEASSQ